MSSGSGSSKFFPSHPFDFLQICASELSGGLDDKEFLLLEECDQEDGDANRPEETGSAKSHSPDKGLSTADPLERNSAMCQVAFSASQPLTEMDSRSTTPKACEETAENPSIF